MNNLRRQLLKTDLSSSATRFACARSRLDDGAAPRENVLQAIVRLLKQTPAGHFIQQPILVANTPLPR